MDYLQAIAKLSDQDVVAALESAVVDERRSLVRVIMLLMEFDGRRLYAKEGHPSTHEYCTRVLGYDDEAAYKRIRVARAAAKHPLVLRRLRDGALSLSAAVALAAHLNAENCAELLDKARDMSKREAEFFAAGLAPKPDLGDNVRALEAERAAPESPPMVKPLSDERVRIAFTADRDVLGMMERAKRLLRRRYPEGKLENVFEEALRALLEKIDPERRLQAKRPRAARPCKDPRRVPQSVRDEVWRRDGGRCTFLNEAGERCPAQDGLEFDHVRPFALGGVSDDPANIRLLCRAHNQMFARESFGEEATTGRAQRAR